MAVEKRFIPPTDIEQQALLNKGAAEALEVEVELDDDELNEADANISYDGEGGAEIVFGDTGPVEGDPYEHYANLAEFIEQDELDIIGMNLASLVDSDVSSRSDWVRLAKDGINLLGLTVEDLDDPFPGSTSAVHPLLIENVVKYQAKARSKLLPPGGPVRTKVKGQKTQEKIKKAERVRNFLNFQLTEEMTEYEPEHDRMLFHQAFYGSAFTKTYFDALLDRPVSRFVKTQDFIIDYYATDLESAERYTEIVPMSGNELRRYQLGGIYRDITIGPSSTAQGTDEIRDQVDKIQGRSKPAHEADEDRYIFYEVHTYLDVPGFEHIDEFEEPTGLKLPYIVTIEKDSQEVVALYRNWDEEDGNFNKKDMYVHWPFVPGLGFYSLGYLHLIGGLSKSATTVMQQLVDAGQFANLPAGFKAHGLRVVGDTEPIAPGEWRDVNAPGIDLQKALLPLPYKEPSGTLFKLLDYMVQAAQKFADTTEQIVSESTNYGPVGTTMALLEAGGKLFTGIHERLFASQKRELRIVADINLRFLDESKAFNSLSGEEYIRAEDFDMKAVDIIPITDPRVPSEAQRIAKAQAQLQIAQQFPAQHNIPALLFRLHSALGEEDPQEVLQKTPKAKSADPVTENAMILKGEPVTTMAPQDHVAHAKVHLAAMKDPRFNKNGVIVSTMGAHIQEHLATQYILEMQMATGIDIAKIGQDPQMQNQIALAAAQASDMVLERGIQQMQSDEEASLIDIEKMNAQTKEDANRIKEEDNIRKDARKGEELQLEAFEAGSDMAISRGELEETRRKNENDRLSRNRTS